MKKALLRDISEGISSCELTHKARKPIDLSLARRQHKAYGSCLEQLGYTVSIIPADSNHPDCVFIEDTVVVVDECAVMTNPGAFSRRGEVPPVEQEVAKHRPIHRIQEPGTLDGGDVLKIGMRILVGASGRSNASGIDQLRSFLAPYGYQVEAIPVSGCLHLKSACTLAAPDRALINPAWVDPERIGINTIAVAPEEPDAANVLLLEEVLVAERRFPHTLQRLHAAGIEPIIIDNSELALAEGGLTCCSVILEVSATV